MASMTIFRSEIPSIVFRHSSESGYGEDDSFSPEKDKIYQIGLAPSG
jgi:hypothetical protein